MSSSNPITIVAFGDSITEAVEQAVEERWPNILWRGLRSCPISPAGARQRPGKAER